MCVESLDLAPARCGAVDDARPGRRGGEPGPKAGTRFTFYDVCIYEVAHDLPCDLAWLEVRDNLPVYSRDGIEREIIGRYTSGPRTCDVHMRDTRDV